MLSNPTNAIGVVLTALVVVVVRKKKMKPKRREDRDREELVADVERLKRAPTPLWKFDHPDMNDIRRLLISLNEKVQEMKNEQKEMRERMNAIKDTVERIDSVVSPSPLWKFVVDHPDIFEAFVLLSGKLNGSDIKMFYECCRASRRAVIRAKIELKEKFWVWELSSISTLELAWEGFPFGESRLFPDGKEGTMNQELFCATVALTNDLKLLRWVREEKECDWDCLTSYFAAGKGNLDILKYCCENGCEVDEGTCQTAAKKGHLACLEYLRSKNIPWDERVCKDAHENNHMDILTYAVKNKCPGFEAFEQFVPRKKKSKTSSERN
jgi:hypothetical protein